MKQKSNSIRAGVLGGLTILIALVAVIKTSDLAIGFLLKGQYGREVAGVHSENDYAVRLRTWKPDVDITFARLDAVNSKHFDGLTQEIIRFRTDPHGFVAPSLRHAKPDLTIAFLGGSTTECGAVPEELRFPYLSALLLESKLGIKINGVNAGRSGNHSLHSTVIHLSKLVPLKPDIVVVMEALNDLTILLNTGTYWNEIPGKSLVFDYKREERSFFSLHGFLRVMKNIVAPNAWYLVRSQLLRYFPEWFDEYSGTRIKRGFQRIDFHAEKEVFRKTLLGLVTQIRNWGAQPILMTQFNRINEQDPYAHELFSRIVSRNEIPFSWYSNTYAEFNQIIRNVGEAEKIPVIDLDVLVPKSRSHIYDHVHVNEEGSRLVAGIVADRIADILAKRPLAAH